MKTQDAGLSIDEQEHLIALAKQFRIGTPKEVLPYGSGAINETYLVKIPRGNPHRRSILQMLHPVFKISVLEDMEAVTGWLVKRGMTTPFLIPTKQGGLCIQEGGHYWRMLSYMPGVSYEYPPDEPRVESSARLLARFHKETASLQWEFKHAIPNFHDTPRIMRKLYEVSYRFKGTMRYDALASLVERVLGAYAHLAPTIPNLPKRLIHSDPKFSNVRFDENGTEAIAMLDLDTLGRGPIIADLGDAVRSWCYASEEKFGKAVNVFSLPYFDAFLRGYFWETSLLGREEKDAVLEGTELLMLELAARFVLDAFEENYFKLGAQKYPNLFEQNRTRALGQLALYEDLQYKRHEALVLLRRHTP